MTLIVPRTTASLSVGVRKTDGAGVVTLALWRGTTQVDNMNVFVDGSGVATFQARYGPGEYHVSVRSDSGKDEADVVVADEQGHVEVTVP